MIRLNHFSRGVLALVLLFPLPGLLLAGAPAVRPALAPPLAPQGGVGPFENSGQSLGGETANGVALGDIDGDNDVDAVVANEYETGQGALFVWVNNGSGTFTAGDVYGIGSSGFNDVALGDLDGDGDLDAVTVGFPLSLSSVDGGVGSHRVWLNQGGDQAGTEGEFAAGDGFGIAAGYSVALGDVDNDGDLDALVAGNANGLWLNNGSGSFSAGPALPFFFSEGAALAHLDGDGYLDAAVVDSANGSSSRVYWNDGNWDPGPGTFTPGPSISTTQLAQAVAIADLDNDGLQDIYVGAYGGDVIYWNDGSRQFTGASPLPIEDSTWGVALGDVDGDTLPDAVVGNLSSNANYVWHNGGNRVFTVIQEFSDDLVWTRDVALADLTGDGRLDLFEATTAEDRVWFNLSQPAVIPNEPGWQRQLLDARGDAGYSPSLALDANGHPHIAYGRLHAGQTDNVSYVYYTWWDGTRWHSEFVENYVSDVRLALDGTGQPHLAFTNGRGSTLFYARRVGGAWEIRTVDTAPFPSTLALGGVAVDADGRPHILYNSYANTGDGPERLMYTRWTGSSWQTETVEDGVIYDSALVLSPGGGPHISYAIRAEFDTYVVKYGLRSGGTWQTEEVDGDIENGGVFVTALALDSGGEPHLAYALDVFQGPGMVMHAESNGGGWTRTPVATVPTGEEITDLALDLNASGDPHLFYYQANPEADRYQVQYAYRDGGTWESTLLDAGYDPAFLRDSVVSAALDGDGNLHGAYYESHYEDLRYITWAPNWQVRTLPETGVVRSPSVAVQKQFNVSVPHVAYYSQTSGQVKLATWDTAWVENPVDFVSAPVDGVSAAAGPQYEHVAHYDADNHRLLYSYWNGSAWTTEVVDEAGDVGRYNDLVLPGHTDGSPAIAYWDATARRIKLARPVLSSVLWNIYPNLAGPVLDADSGPLSLAALPGGFGVAYYDGANDDLRYAFWSGASGTWTDELVDGAGDTGRLNSIQIDNASGAPVIAYLGQGALRWAFKLGGTWITADVPGTDGETITGLSLELGMDSREHARIAYTTASGGVYVAVRRNGAWHIEVVAGSGAAAASGLSSDFDSRPHLAYVRSGTGLNYAFRTSNLDIDLGNPEEPFSQYYGYNPLDPCGHLESGGQAGAAHLHAPGSPPHPHFVTGVLGAVEPGSLSDDVIFDALGGVFYATPAGQAYINLYNQHASEAAQIALDDPALAWDAFGTLQNFMPGLEALVSGRGHEHVVTQAMVDDALDVWQRVAAAASPALADTINAELAKYDNLQAFVGLTFDEWAEAIGVQPPPEVYYFPIIRR